MIYLFDITPLTFIVDYQSEKFESEIEDFLSFYMMKSVNQANDLLTIDLLRRKNYYCGPDKDT